MKQLPALLTLVISSVLTLSCGNTSVAGATSETTNGIATTVVSSANKPVAGADVYLSPANAIRQAGEPDRFPKTATRIDGTFTLDSLDTIDYIVEVVDSLNNRAMGKILYNSATKSYKLEKRDTLTLFSAGKLKGKVAKTSGQTVLVQIYGLHRIIETDSEGNFVLDSLPAGRISYRISTSTNTVALDTAIISSDSIEDVGEFKTKEFEELLAKGISSTVVNSTGYSVKGAGIFLSLATELSLPESEIRQAKAKTDANGFFVIADQTENDYIVEAKDSAGNRAMGRFVFDQTQKRHILVGQANLQLRPTAKIYGDIFKQAGEKVTVQIFGLHRAVSFETPDTVSHFSIDSLPAGTITIKITSNNEVIAIDSITIAPNELKNIGQFRTKTFEEVKTDSAIVREILDLNGKMNVQIKDVAPTMKEGKITELNLDNLDLDTLPATIGKLRLTELSIGSNSIRSLPAELFNISPLTYLDISGNPLGTLSEDIVKLQSLETLDIENIDIKTLPVSITKTKIHFLFINGNAIVADKLPWDIREWIDKCAMDKGWSSKQTDEN